MRNSVIILIFASLSAVCASGAADKYVPWKDPLSKDELDALMRLHYKFERERGAEAKKAHEPTVAEPALKSPINFLGLAFGAAGKVREKGECCYCNGVLKEYFLSQALPQPYFCFLSVREYLAPHTKRLFKISMRYRDYDRLKGSKGFVKDPRHALETGRAIVNDLGKRLGIPLQELRLFRQIWPYHPGIKVSTCWSGSIPENYVCTEEEWLKARHGFAHSRTRTGDYRIHVSVEKIYYDEYTFSVTVEDAKELANAEKEFEEASSKAKARFQE